MTTILLTVSYDGTDFCGWQRQTVAVEEGAVDSEGCVRILVFQK